MAVEREHRRASLARRDALLGAAVRVMAERGRAGVTHRSVTEAAGLPRATVSYFWSSIDDLVDEALRAISEREVAHLVELAGDLGDDPSVDRFGAVLAEAAAPQHPENLAVFEMYLSAARDPAYRDAALATLASYRHAAEAGVRSLGLSDPAAAAPAFVALSDGFALHQLAGGLTGSDADADALLGAFRTLLIGFLVQRGQVDEALVLAGHDPRPTAPTTTDDTPQETP